MARKEDYYMHVLFIGVGIFDSKDEDNVRFRQELIHQHLIGEIMDSNTDHSSETPNNLSIKALERTFHD